MENVGVKCEVIQGKQVVLINVEELRATKENSCKVEHCDSRTKAESSASPSPPCTNCEEIAKTELVINLADPRSTETARGTGRCSAANSREGRLSSGEALREGGMCRICHSGETSEVLIAPCRCCGSAKFVHQSCMLLWFDRKRDKICELCLYEVEMQPKGFKPPSKWKLPSRSCDFVAFLFTFYCIVLLSFIGMVLWVASNRCVSPVCVVLYFVCTVALLYFTYCCGCIRQISDYWKSWLDINREMFILSRKESKAVPAMLDFGRGLKNSLEIPRRGRAVHAC